MPVQLLLSILQLLLPIFLLIAFGYLLYRLFSSGLRRHGATGEPWSISFALFFSAVFFTCGMLLKEAGTALFAAVQILQKQGAGEALLLESGRYALYFVGISILSLLLILGLTAYLFALLRKKGILQAIAADDYASVVFCCAAMLTFTLLSLGYVRQFMELLVPYPELPGFY
jgi:hypothetical protein